MAVVIETSIGDFTIDLLTEERPRTCLNFLKLCKLKYYNFNLLYSVERNFVAQMGDPTGSGRGGDSIFKSMFGDQARLYEGEKLPVLKHTHFGTVSMVAYGDNMYGSQFFVTLCDQLDSLDEEHLVFGHVTEGLDVIAKLNDVLTDEKNRPYQDIRICHTVILDDPFPDPENVSYPDESPRPTAEVLASDYIAVDESVDDAKGKDMAEIQEEIEAKEAEARATILEMVGDLPDADMAPPENVLFVCKLNPVTTSEDLEIIFSRFGKIVCAEVIKDRITGNSLQYAFIEFDNKKSCEDAYFKMDNVLIDDRRIHVDFSQSVSKIQWRGRGRGVVLYDDHGKKLQDKKESKFQPNSNNLSKKDSEPKSRFIDTEAYGKRFKEQQESRNGEGRRTLPRENTTSSRSATHSHDSRARDSNDRRPDRGGRDHDRRPERDGRDYDRRPERDGRDYDRRPERDGRDYDRRPERDGKDYDRRPDRGGRDHDRRPERDGKDYDRRPERDGKDYDRRPEQDGRDYDERQKRDKRDNNVRPDHDRKQNRDGRDQDKRPESFSERSRDHVPEDREDGPLRRENVNSRIRDERHAADSDVCVRSSQRPGRGSDEEDQRLTLMDHLRSQIRTNKKKQASASDDHTSSDSEDSDSSVPAKKSKHKKSKKQKKKKSKRKESSSSDSESEEELRKKNKKKKKSKKSKH